MGLVGVLCVAEGDGHDAFFAGIGDRMVGQKLLHGVVVLHHHDLCVVVTVSIEKLRLQMAVSQGCAPQNPSA